MTGYWFLPLIFQLKARNEPSIRLTDCVAFHPCSTFTHVLWLSHQCLPTSLPSLAQAWPFDVVWPGKHEQKCVVTSGRSFKSQGIVCLFSLPLRHISEVGDKGQSGAKLQPTCDNHNTVQEKPEKAMAPHSSALAWKIPGTEEPGGLQSMGLLRVGHD